MKLTVTAYIISCIFLLTGVILQMLSVTCLFQWFFDDKSTSTDCEQKVAVMKFQADRSYQVEQYDDALCYYQKGQRKLLLFTFYFV